ncbi:MAG TPA: pseudouridine synthase [Burkholderiales bacterium]|nr:pseudouridine synthase [Burkholderiales bacterium]
MSTKSPRKPAPPPAPTAERLQKLLAGAGLGSRREIEGWISAGRITVNGNVAELGMRAGPQDEIRVDGKPVTLAAAAGARVLLYHKPVGELVTRSDPRGRRTVFASLPPGRWVAVGRLDLNSSGLLVLTDSGELANRLMHPRYGLEREYAARVRGELRADERKQLLEGVMLDGEPARFERIETYREGEGSNRWYRVVLTEGRNREVRRLFEALGHPVSKLVRLRYGPVELPADLAPGRWRELHNPVILQKL